MKKILAPVVITAMSISWACRSEVQTPAQNEPGNVRSVQSKKENKSNNDKAVVRETEKVSNIKQRLNFSNERPAIISIITSKKLNFKAVGLKKGQIMPKHKAGLKSLIIILEGKIEMTMDGRKIELDELDVYEIPANVEHEILGIKQSIFSLTQEK
ncbi:MAG: cupin domain-containing protein [Pyrinomonadaceae bacterium]|nr:cupin domain-containing protein [Pyrinomonadaceae bacterium]